MSTLNTALSALPQDLLRTLQRAADCLDLHIDGLTIDEIVQRYGALGCEITPEFAARLQSESAAARTGDGDVAVSQGDQHQLPVGSDVNDGAGLHGGSVASRTGTSRPHNYALLQELRPHATVRDAGIAESPQEVEIHGFQITDCTFTDPHYTTGHMVWLGHPSEGRWLSAAEALGIARALRLIALTQMRRVAAEGGAA